MNIRLKISEVRPANFTVDYDPILFQCKKHRTLQYSGEWRSFYLFHESQKVLLGECHFAVEDNCYFSPYRATFGGPSLSSQLKSGEIRYFLKNIIEFLSEKGAKKIMFMPAHEMINNNFNNLTYNLLKLGFEISNSQLHSVIKINNTRYVDCIQLPDLKRRLRKSYREGLIFKEGTEANDYREVHSFIAEERKRKGYVFSMTEEDLIENFNHFPEPFRVFSVRDGDTVIAAAICIAIDESTLYDFAHAHNPDYDKYSPVVRLIEGIYDFAHRRHFKYLDLGSSEIGAKTNGPLLYFKENLGGEGSLKHTFEKQLK